MSESEHTLDGLCGEVLADKYRLKALLGRGGMGFVYLAEQVDLGRSVAVKVLRRELIATRFEWFRTEAMAASRINHPHAVAIYDFGLTQDNIPYLVMEHLRGQTLTKLVHAQPLAPARIATIGSQILSALDEAHACGVVHCDLTGDNVIVETLRDGDDFAKVIDFGLARLFETRGATEKIFGTSEYMAPEQIRGRMIDPRTDLYSVGVILYEMIVGRTPFAGQPQEAILQGHLEVEPQPPHLIIPSCPKPLSEVVVTALSKEPEGRFANAASMRAQLMLSVPGASSIATITTSARQTLTGLAAPGVAKNTMDQGPTRRTSRINIDVSALHRGIVGREEDVKEIARFFDGIHDHRAIAIVGNRGIGKARLANEAMSRANENLHFVRTGADPSGLKTSWYPILAAVEAALSLTETPQLAELSVAIARCGLPDRDLPGLAEIFSLSDGQGQPDASVRRVEAHSAAVRTLLATRRRYQDVVFVFADIDRYDQPSLSVLSELCERAHETGIRVLVTCEKLPNEFRELHQIALQGLPPQEARELAIMLTRSSCDVPSALTVHALTGGSPAAVEQLAGWMSLGNATQDAPTLLVDLVSVRIHRLPAPARRVLQAVAIHGSVAPRWLVEDNLDPDERNAFENQDWTGLLVVDKKTLAIPTDLVADVIGACTPADVRRRLHRRALEALRGQGCPGICGHHAEHSGELQHAFDLYVQAGDTCIRQFDDPGAATWYGRALRIGRLLHTRGVEHAASRIVDTCVLIAEALRSTEERGLALGVLDEASGFQPNDRQIAMIERARGLIHASAGTFATALSHFERALGAAMRSGERSFLCHCYLDLADTLDKCGRSDDATRELEQAVDVITLGDGLSAKSIPDKLWRVGLTLAQRYLEAGQRARALQTAKEALSLTARQSEQHGHGRALSLLAQICDSMGDGASALRYRTRALAEMRKLGDRRSTAELLIDAARATQELGKPARSATDGNLRLARQLAAEIGWNEGIELSQRQLHSENR